MKRTLPLSLLFIVFSAITSSAQNIIPDSLFGNNSILFVDPGIGESGANLLLQPDGKIIFGGFDYDISVNAFYNDMVRFDQCGIIDSTFGTNGIVHHTFEQRNLGYIYQLQSDGKILVGGIQSTSNAGSQQFPFIARYKADGSPDTSFASTGSYKTTFDGSSAGSIYSIYTLPDGRIVSIGTCNCGGGGVIRLLPDGTPDVTFDGDGKALQTFANFSAFSEVYGHLLQDGKTVLIGATWDGSFVDHFVAFRFDSTGVLDASFGTAGFFNDTTPLDVYSYGLATGIQADEKVIMAANRPSLQGIELLRINTDGTIDTTFGTSGHVSIPTVNADVKKIKVLGNGQILVMCNLNSTAFGEMINPDGSIDSTFGTNGSRIFDLNNGSSNDGLLDLLELLNGKWIAGTTISSGFQAVKFANQSNVPHVSFDGTQLITTGTGTYQWYLNDTLISGETDSILTPAQTGNYTLQLTDSSGCTYESDLLLVNVGIEVPGDVSFTAFPNPADKEVTFNFIHNPADCTIRISDISGLEVGELPVARNTASSVTINTVRLPGGIYFVHIASSNNYHVSRLVIQH